MNKGSHVINSMMSISPDTWLLRKKVGFAAVVFLVASNLMLTGCSAGQAEAPPENTTDGLTLTLDTASHVEGTYRSENVELRFALEKNEAGSAVRVTAANGEVLLEASDENLRAHATVAGMSLSSSELPPAMDPMAGLSAKQRDLISELFLALGAQHLDRRFTHAIAEESIGSQSSALTIPPNCEPYAKDECCFGFWKWNNYHLSCAGDTNPFVGTETGWFPNGFCFGGYCAYNLDPRY